MKLVAEGDELAIEESSKNRNIKDALEDGETGKAPATRSPPTESQEPQAKESSNKPSDSKEPKRHTKGLYLQRNKRVSIA